MEGLPVHTFGFAATAIQYAIFPTQAFTNRVGFGRGSVAGAFYMRQQLQTGAQERVDLYFPDGTLLELGPEDAAAEELLKQGRELLTRANPEGS